MEREVSGYKKLIVGWLIFIVGASFYSYEYLLRVLPSIMVPELMQTHGINTAMLGALSGAYYITYTLMQIPVGILIDYYGPKRLLFFASMICIIGSLLFANPDSFLVALIGRILIGAGSAFAFVGVLRLALLWLPAKQFAIATGLITTLGMFGGIVGDDFLSQFSLRWGGQATLLLSAIAGVPILLAIFFIPKQKAEQATWQDAQRSLFKAGLELGRIIKRPTLWVNALVGCLLYFPLSAFAELWGIPYLEAARNLTSTQASQCIACIMLGWAVGAPLVGAIAGYFQRRLRIIFMGSCLSITTILLVFNLPSLMLWQIKIFLFLFGLFCSGQILIMVIVNDLVDTHVVATAMAFTNMLIMSGGIIIQPFIGRLVKQTTTDALAHAYTRLDASIYTQAMMIIPLAIALALVALIVLAWLMNARKKESDSTQIIFDSSSE